MVLAHSALTLLIVTALVHAASTDLWAEYDAALQVDCATRLRAVPHLLVMARLQPVTTILAGFGRTVSEVGAILIVDGNPRPPVVANARRDQISATRASMRTPTSR